MERSYIPRQCGVDAESIDLAVDLQQHVLRHFFRVFTVLHVAHRQLRDPGAIAVGQILDGRFVTRLETGDELPVLGRIHRGCPLAHITPTDSVLFPGRVILTRLMILVASSSSRLLS